MHSCRCPRRCCNSLVAQPAAAAAQSSCRQQKPSTSVACAARQHFLRSPATAQLLLTDDVSRCWFKGDHVSHCLDCQHGRGLRVQEGLRSPRSNSNSSTLLPSQAQRQPAVPGVRHVHNQATSQNNRAYTQCAHIQRKHALRLAHVVMLRTA
jgi:hypothetical protein